MQSSALTPSAQQQLLRERGICVVIPTYNNGATIANVVKRAFAQCADVIVVDDGCTDGTAQKLQEVAGLTILTHERNKGKGAALKTGLRYARKAGFAYAITLDSDGQHFPEDIPLLVEANRKHPGSLIVGQRELEGVERSAGSNFANNFSNFWFMVQTGTRLPDTQSGYRLYPLRHLYGLSFLSNRYEAELLLMVLAAWHGVEIVSTPINVYYPPCEERVSHFRPAKDFTRISILNTILCILALVYALPIAVIRKIIRVSYTLYALAFYLFTALPVLTPIAWGCALLTSKEGCGKVLRKILHVVGKLIVKWHGIPGVKHTVANPHHEKFSKPAMIICNHQSHLDLMVILAQSDKFAFLTNDWVWNSPFFGHVIRRAEYYPTSMGIDNLLPNLKSLVERGYSIVVFPEGTRSRDGKIGRFHKGAFYIAQQLGLDILPMMLYGANRVLPKKGKMLQRGLIHLDIKHRYAPEEYSSIASSTQGVASWFRRYYLSEFAALTNKLDQYA